MISVLMPVYNGERFLQPAIESILGQTCRDFELLVLDDGSTDRSVEIVSSFRDQRIRLCSLKHQGLIPTLNAGLQEARGQWIARMDCDDVALPHRLQRQADYVSCYTDVVALGGAAEVIDEHGHLIGQVSRPPSAHSALLANLTWRKWGPGLIHPTVMFRREEVVCLGGYRARFPVCEDTELWLRLARQGRLHSLPEPVLLLRKHGQNISLVKSQVATESHIAAVVCQELWSRTGVDLGSEHDEVWALCTQMVRAVVDAKDLMGLRMARNDFVAAVRQRSLTQAAGHMAALVMHPDRFRSLWLRSVMREIVESVVEAMERLVRKRRSSGEAASSQPVRTCDGLLPQEARDEMC